MVPTYSNAGRTVPCNDLLTLFFGEVERQVFVGEIVVNEIVELCWVLGSHSMKEVQKNLEREAFHTRKQSHIVDCNMHSTNAAI